MKNAFKPITVLLLIALNTLFACKKKTDDPTDFTVDDKNLTDCPQGSTCYFQYVNYASLVNNQLTLATGQYRVFWTRSEGNYGSRILYFLAPMAGDKFLLKDKDVAEGRVKYVSGCPVCNSIGSLKAIDGSVKGVKIAKSNAGYEKWLLESNIVLALEGSMRPLDTIYIKQYYYAAVQ